MTKTRPLTSPPAATLFFIFVRGFVIQNVTGSRKKRKCEDVTFEKISYFFTLSKDKTTT